MRKYRYGILFSGFVLYSLIGVLAKSAAGVPVLSLPWAMRYLAVLAFLALYSVMWQVSLKYLDLSAAFMYKGLVVILSLIWSRIIFAETITTNNILGSVIIIAGILVYSYDIKMA